MMSIGEQPETVSRENEAQFQPFRRPERNLHRYEVIYFM